MKKQKTKTKDQKSTPNQTSMTRVERVEEAVVDVREILRNHYDSMRRDDEYEPPWTHPFFEPAYSGATLDEHHAPVAAAIVEGKRTRSEPNVWREGCRTWVFMRRRSCVPVAFMGWTIINATASGRTYWLAYDETHRVGLDHYERFPDESVGVADSLERIKAAVAEQVALEAAVEEAKIDPTLSDAERNLVVDAFNGAWGGLTPGYAADLWRHWVEADGLEQKIVDAMYYDELHEKWDVNPTVLRAKLRVLPAVDRCTLLQYAKAFWEAVAGDMSSDNPFCDDEDLVEARRPRSS